MNILYLAHRIPYPPDKGDKLRAFRQIEYLARRHRVWCACFVDNARDFRHMQKLRDYCQDVAAIELSSRCAKACGLWSMACGGTITEGFYASGEMDRWLADWQRAIDFDAVVAFSSSMASYALRLRAARRILDLCDLDSLKWADYADHIRIKPRKGVRDRVLARLYDAETARLSAAELRWIDGVDAAVLATEIEVGPLRGLVRDAKLHVIGNGVDVWTACSTAPTGLASSHGQGPGDKSLGYCHEVPTGLERGCDLTVGFVGVMNYLPNVDAVSWFANECWPAIRARHPNATFRIVGRSPTRAVRKLARIPGVTVVGEVDVVSDELSRFDVSVAPLRIARGVQNKVLEAMAAGKAVVLTPKAAQGIGAVDGQDYVVAESDGNFAEAVFQLLEDNSARDRIGQSGRDFVKKNRRWESEMEKFEALVMEGRPTSSKFSFEVQGSKNQLENPRVVLSCATPFL